MTENEWLIVAHNIISDYIDQVVDHCDERPEDEEVPAALAGAAKLAKACSLIETLVQEMKAQDRGLTPVKVEGYVIIPQDVAKRLMKILTDSIDMELVENLNDSDAEFKVILEADIAVLQEACADPEGGDAS